MAQRWNVGAKPQDDEDAPGMAWVPSEAAAAPSSFPGFQMGALQNFVPDQRPQVFPTMVDYRGAFLGQYAGYPYYNTPAYGVQELPKNSVQGYPTAPAFHPPLPYFGAAPLPYHQQPYQPGGGAFGRPMQSDIHSDCSSGKTPSHRNGFTPNKRGWKRGRDFNNANGNDRQFRNNRSSGGQEQRSAAPLRCQSCERNFVGRAQMDAHFKTHVKCGVADCTFEAIGTLVNEHRAQAHMKPSEPPKPLSKEQAEEIRRWREARRKNYPTTENMQRKLQRLQERQERGELVDEEALKRQESLKQILNKQKELGCPVAEVPPYYLSRAYAEGSLSRKQVKAQGDEEREDGEITTNEQQNGGKKRGRKPCMYFQQGRCRKGRRCTFLHDNSSRRRESIKHELNKQQPWQGEKQEDGALQQPPARKQNLLAKLLQPEIQRDKSYLLQCFRFLVKNKFLLDDQAQLEFFEWSRDEEESNGAAAGPPKLEIIDEAEAEEDDEEEEEEEEAESMSEEEDGELEEDEDDRH